MIIWSIPRENLHWRKQNKVHIYPESIFAAAANQQHFKQSSSLLTNKEKNTKKSVSKHQFKAKQIICLSKCRVIWKRAYTLTETFAVTAAAKQST